MVLVLVLLSLSLSLSLHHPQTLANNHCLALTKIGEFAEAAKAASDALAANPEYVKALYSRANAYFLNGEFKHALKDIAAAFEKEPKNAGVRRLYKQIRAKVAAVKKREKKIFGGMFGAGGKASLYDEKPVVRFGGRGRRGGVGRGERERRGDGTVTLAKANR